MGSDLVGVAPARGERIGRTLVPDDRWEIVEPLLPIQQARPQGGDTASVDDSACSPRFVHVLTTGCARRDLPAELGVSKATAHRQFVAWTHAGLWRRRHLAVLDRLGEQAGVDRSRAVAAAADVRVRGGLADPVDWGNRLQAARAHLCPLSSPGGGRLTGQHPRQRTSHR